MDTLSFFVPGEIEVREGRAGEPSFLGGYAAVFGRETIIDGPKGERWRERIEAGAFDDVLDRSDTIAAVNHDMKLVLGRAKTGTLKLSVDRIGLRYDVKLPNTSLARDTVENVRNGNYSGSSFKFVAQRGGIRVERPRHVDDLPLLVIERVTDLIDVGPVTFPAYSDASVSVRMKDMLAEHDACVRALSEVAQRDRLRARLAIEKAKAWE